MVANSQALGTLGDPTRRAIFEQLGERPSAVVDLAALLVSRPAVSQHLKVLKDAGLVRDVRVGDAADLQPRSRWSRGTARLYFDRFWNTALHSFKARVERRDQREETP